MHFLECLLIDPVFWGVVIHPLFDHKLLRERDRSGISHWIAKKVGFSSFPLLFYFLHFVQIVLFKFCWTILCILSFRALEIIYVFWYIRASKSLFDWFHVNWESEMCGIAMKSNTGWSVWNWEDHWPSSWKGFDFFSLKSLYGVKTNRIPLLIMCQSNVLGRLRPILFKGF